MVKNFPLKPLSSNLLIYCKTIPNVLLVMIMLILGQIKRPASTTTRRTYIDGCLLPDACGVYVKAISFFQLQFLSAPNSE